MQTSVVVIGAGHTGLAVSNHLTRRSIDHVLIERGEVANTWRTERWDSLRLLTPNWQSRLPGLAYDDPHPDSFMTMPEVVAFVARYAGTISAPIHTQTTVTSVRRVDSGYVVETDRGSWTCLAVFIATGAFNRSRIPEMAAALPKSIEAVTPIEYRSPERLREGGVLVVGASATGVQIADEVQRSGRQVTLAVGEHVRMPRVYRGRDILWWMDRIGLLDERYDEVEDIVRARHVPSPQLVGTTERETLDLNALTERGANIVGRLETIRDGEAILSGSLANKCELADLKMDRLLDSIDEYDVEHALDDAVAPPHRFHPTKVEASPPLSLSLMSGEVESIIWATGYTADYSWLDVPVLDRKGRLRHEGGVVTDSPGLYRIGLNFLLRRKSSFIHGADDDARDLTAHLATHLDSLAHAPLTR